MQWLYNIIEQRDCGIKRGDDDVTSMTEHIRHGHYGRDLRFLPFEGAAALEVLRIC